MTKKEKLTWLNFFLLIKYYLIFIIIPLVSFIVFIVLNIKSVIYFYILPNNKKRLDFL